ncbi:MAG: 2-oxoglutarate dehydrogenase E1 component, partial [Reinekea forsetii]|nr:2-oxoglutarate dehydrogenase E1 component [Reinekea forsetii]
MQNASMEEQWLSSHFSGGNQTYLDEMYEAYLLDPNSVPEQWRTVFDKLPNLNDEITTDTPHQPVRDHFLLMGKTNKIAADTLAPSLVTEHERKQVRVHQLATAFRFRGHQNANLDPLNLSQRKSVPDLELKYHGLTDADSDSVFQCGNLYFGKKEATLQEIHDAMSTTYCSSIGAEFTHIVNTSERRWIE